MARLSDFLSAVGETEGVFATSVEGDTENDISANEDGAICGDGATNLLFSLALLELYDALSVFCLGLAEHARLQDDTEGGEVAFMLDCANLGDLAAASLGSAARAEAALDGAGDASRTEPGEGANGGLGADKLPARLPIGPALRGAEPRAECRLDGAGESVPSGLRLAGSEAGVHGNELTGANDTGIEIGAEDRNPKVPCP